MIHIREIKVDRNASIDDDIMYQFVVIEMYHNPKAPCLLRLHTVGGGENPIIEFALELSDVIKLRDQLNTNILLCDRYDQNQPNIWKMN